jgi:NAD(P)-dependent dehydrogenase (short-subunit alcohol dehydrogenase family)
MNTSTAPCAIITGAASGIGLATAQQLARLGWRLGLFDIQGDAVRALAASLSPGQAVHLGQTLDVTDPQAWAQAMDAFMAHTGGRLDLLINNAGIAVADPFVDTPLTNHHRMVQVNVLGVMNGCHTASALFGQPQLATYSATKAAIKSLTESLDTEWAVAGVRVVDVLPLFVDTAMVRNEVAKMGTVKSLGVHLTADDVARKLVKLATAPSRSLPLHTLVGWQTPLLDLACRLSPAWVNQRVTRWLAGLG